MSCSCATLHYSKILIAWEEEVTTYRVIMMNYFKLESHCKIHQVPHVIHSPIWIAVHVCNHWGKYTLHWDLYNLALHGSNKTVQYCFSNYGFSTVLLFLWTVEYSIGPIKCRSFSFLVLPSHNFVIISNSSSSLKCSKHTLEQRQ